MVRLARVRKTKTGKYGGKRVQNRKTARKSPVKSLAYQSLAGWAIGTLIETHAIAECADHGHMRQRGWPHGWDEARAIAKVHPFSGATPEQCIVAIDDVMDSTGDVCPEC